MQFTDNNYGAQPNNKKVIILIAVSVVSIAIIAVLALQRSNKQAPPDAGLYHDPNSGEIVSDPEGWQPENFAGQANAPIFLGFSKLLDIGITQFQLDAAKGGFGEYSATKNDYVKEVSLHVNSIKREAFDPDGADPTRRVSFTVTINRTETFSAKLEYTTIQNASLLLYKDDKRIFKSTSANADEKIPEHPGEDVLEPEFPR